MPPSGGNWSSLGYSKPAAYVTDLGCEAGFSDLRNDVPGCHPTTRVYKLRVNPVSIQKAGKIQMARFGPKLAVMSSLGASGGPDSSEMESGSEGSSVSKKAMPTSSHWGNFKGLSHKPRFPAVISVHERRLLSLCPGGECWAPRRGRAPQATAPATDPRPSAWE